MRSFYPARFRDKNPSASGVYITDPYCGDELALTLHKNVYSVYNLKRSENDVVSLNGNAKEAPLCQIVSIVQIGTMRTLLVPEFPKTKDAFSFLSIIDQMFVVFPVAMTPPPI